MLAEPADERGDFYLLRTSRAHLHDGSGSSTWRYALRRSFGLCRQFSAAC